MKVEINSVAGIVRLAIVIVCLSLSTSVRAQEARVEQSVFGVQTGVLGIWGHGEFRMSKELALRVELGLDGSFWDGTMYEKTGFLFEPVLTAEPRWYYNLVEREGKSKSIGNNSGNFISVKCSFHPDWFVISRDDNVHRSRDISIAPTWGIRRNLGKSFNYEAGIGVGYRYIFDSRTGLPEQEGDVIVNLHLRIGYIF